MAWRHGEEQSQAGTIPKWAYAILMRQGRDLRELRQKVEALEDRLMTEEEKLALTMRWWPYPMIER